MTNQEMQRSQEGAKAGIIGFGCNLILAAAKLFVGIAGSSITVIADGANNLTDSISALLTILGFRMEAIGEDEMHPYGHGRIEYVTGFLISILILGTGISIGKESVMRILHPKTSTVSALTIVVLVISVLVKVGMMFYYQRKNRRMESPTLEAVEKDSLSDACVSALALAGILLTPRCRLPLDGILGITMAVYIFISGLKSFGKNLALLLGEGANGKVESELRRIFSECKEIESVREIKIHDYGPERKIAVAEVNFVESCDDEAKRRAVDYVIRLCKDTMNVEISLYSSVY